MFAYDRESGVVCCYAFGTTLSESTSRRGAWREFLVLFVYTFDVVISNRTFPSMDVTECVP
jgi:hypothetical protein